MFQYGQGLYQGFFPHIPTNAQNCSSNNINAKFETIFLYCHFLCTKLCIEPLLPAYSAFLPEIEKPVLKILMLTLRS